MGKRIPPKIAKGKCICGGSLLLSYKNRDNGAKCLSCGRWLIITRKQFEEWRNEGTE